MNLIDVESVENPRDHVTLTECNGHGCLQIKEFGRGRAAVFLDVDRLRELRDGADHLINQLERKKSNG